jgi:uncharacterized membrane protein (UPF0127 family)
MKFIKITNQTNQKSTRIRAKYCESFFCQLRGLMFKKNILDDQGILLVQRKDSIVNASIHMMFMYMDLAVIWINSENAVVDKVLARRWKIAYLPKCAAKYVLETGVSHLSEYNIGDKVRFEESN